MRLAVAIGVGVVLSACSLLVSTADLSGGAEGADASSTSSSGDAQPSSTSGTTPNEAGQSDAVPIEAGRACPSGRGPVMVDTGAYCIDSTEITQAQWGEFVAALVPPSDQEARCSFNSSFTPINTGSCANTFTPQTTPNNPVVCITWCDVTAFCKWAGKRICHGDEWLGACTNNHAQQFPYPGAFDENKCNGPDHGVEASLPVGSMKTCEGGYQGLFDMAGNITELEGDCPGDQCNRRGGSFDSSSAAKCDFLLTGPLDFNTPFVGGRCCADRH
jgi:sulfatase modifying factor 1